MTVVFLLGGLDKRGIFGATSAKAQASLVALF